MHLLRRSKELYCCLALFLAGCGQHKVDIIQPELSSYYTRFINEAVIENISLSIGSISITEVTTLNPGELGRCTAGGDMPIVTISQAYWNSASDASKEQLLFHELGHCLLGRVHLDGVTPKGIPMSIMNTYHFDDFTYLENHEYYMRELFLGPLL